MNNYIEAFDALLDAGYDFTTEELSQLTNKSVEELETNAKSLADYLGLDF